MRNRSLKTAVMGCGRIGWSFHIPELLEHEEFELVAVVDPLQERLQEAKTKFGISRTYKNTQELYAQENLDLIVVASPTCFHKEQILEAFAHDCDVFCDKPLALSLEETDEILAAMREYQRKLMVYQPHRTSNVAQSLKWLLQSNMLGDIYMIKHAVTQFARRADWQAFKRNGGGMLNNYGAHFIDQFLYLNASPISKVACELRAVATLGDADDVVKTVITAENGIMLDLDINMASAHAVEPWYVLGSRGAARFDAEKNEWQVRYFLAEDLANMLPQSGMAAKNRAYCNGEFIPWRTESVKIDAFKPLDFYAKCAEYFLFDKTPFVPVSETREVMRVLETCRRSAGW